MIIALAGNMGVGKDTVADVLEKNHGFRRTSFALALKNLCIRLFEFDQRTMFGPSAGTRGMKTPIYAYEAPVTSMPMPPLPSTVVFRMRAMLPLSI